VNAEGGGGMSGCLEILNVGAGHRTVEFDPSDDAQRAKTAVMIADMLKRGYSIFVDIGGSHVRVRRFIAQHHAYLIDEPEDEQTRAESDTETCRCGKRKGHRGRCLGSKRSQGREIPVGASRAVAVGRSAGG
jgi:hypothetical protein